MKHSLLSLLPALACCCLPASAGMLAGLKLGEKMPEVRRKVIDSKDFTPLKSRARSTLEGTYHLSTNVAGQKWLAHFIFDRRTKELTQLIFVNNKPMQPSQYNGLLKPFYVFTQKHLREHFKLENPINLPEFGAAGSLKVEEMFPLHAHPGDGIMLTMGLWKAKSGGIHLCFSVLPTVQSALGNTYASNTAGKQEEWDDIPDFTATAAGKAFLAEAGLDDKDKIAQEEPQEEEPEVPTFAAVSTSLPQAEQDVLNGLQLLAQGEKQEGMAKLVAAGKAGNARALYELGCCAADGLYGVTQDEAKAEAAFKQSAKAGYALALVRYGAEFPEAIKALGLTNEEGQKMLDKAVAAPASSPSARFNYAIMTRYGYGLRKDAAEARTLMEELSAEGDPVAGELVKEWEL